MPMFSKLPRARFSFAILLLFVAVSCGVAVRSYASKSDLMSIHAAEESKDPAITLYRGNAEIVDIGGPIADIMIADPEIVDVTVLQSNRLYHSNRHRGLGCVYQSWLSGAFHAGALFSAKLGNYLVHWSVYKFGDKLLIPFFSLFLLRRAASAS